MTTKKVTPETRRLTTLLPKQHCRPRALSHPARAADHRGADADRCCACFQMRQCTPVARRRQAALGATDAPQVPAIEWRRRLQRARYGGQVREGSRLLTASARCDWPAPVPLPQSGRRRRGRRQARGRDPPPTASTTTTNRRPRTSPLRRLRAAPPLGPTIVWGRGP